MKLIKPIFLFFLLGLNFLSGCDYVYRLLDKEGAQEKELIGEVSPFEKNPIIEEVQTLLKIYGYSPGTVDGVLGLNTRNMIEKFQRDNELKPSRFVDEETWKKLLVFKENGLVMDGQVNVMFLQKLLNAAGFPVGEADGEYGPRTKKSVEDFQKAHQLKADGRVGYKTMQALSQYIAQ
ncbi:MAG: peptidoglycan-binding protein [Candidatus Omnitrophica bacterium]|nr:peptidoglycan-binding protein [Candidatus Omnitrophota bacterium]